MCMHTHTQLLFQLLVKHLWEYNNATTYASFFSVLGTYVYTTSLLM